MRDLKRPNAKLPAYKFLESLGVSFFTPMHWRLIVRDGKRISEYVPFIADLLFVYETREKLGLSNCSFPMMNLALRNASFMHPNY